jgi:hypothetical protein
MECLDIEILRRASTPVRQPLSVGQLGKPGTTHGLTFGNLDRAQKNEVKHGRSSALQAIKLTVW